MDRKELLLKEYTNNYNKGMDLAIHGNLNDAKYYLTLAVNTNLELIKLLDNSEKTLFVERATEIEDLIKQMEINITEDNRINVPISERTNSTTVSKTTKNSNSKEEDGEITEFTPANKTGIKLSDIAGLEEAKEAFNNKVIKPLKYPNEYSEYGVKSGGGVLLYGLPGTGKTMFAKAIANELDAAFYSIKCSDIVSKWFGDSEKKIHDLFTQAKENKVSVIFFDEVEGIASKRDTNSTVMKRIVPQLLAEMDGFENKDNKSTLLVLAATNRPWDLDSGFLRPGRFDVQVYVPLPDDKARDYLIRKQLPKNLVSHKFDYAKAVEATKNFSGADIVEFCNRVKLFAIDRVILVKESGITDPEVLNNNLDCVKKITNKDIEDAAKYVSSSASLSDVKKLEKFREEKIK